MAALLVGDDVARLAGRLAVVHALRGMDSIHLASAVSIPRMKPVVVTADLDLASGSVLRRAFGRIRRLTVAVYGLTAALR